MTPTSSPREAWAAFVDLLFHPFITSFSPSCSRSSGVPWLERGKPGRGADTGQQLLTSFLLLSSVGSISYFGDGEVVVMAETLAFILRQIGNELRMSPMPVNASHIRMVLISGELASTSSYLYNCQPSSPSDTIYLVSDDPKPLTAGSINPLRSITASCYPSQTLAAYHGLT